MIDLTGQVFGKLKVIQKSEKNKHGKITFKCECQCGKIKDFVAYNLSNGISTSCGCSQYPKGASSKYWKGFGEISSFSFSRIRAGATRRNIDFEISIEEIWKLFLEQHRKCNLSGIALSFSSCRRLSKNQTASLDRIDSSKGYTIDNVQWIHKDLNEMKMAKSQEEFVNYCKLVAKNFEGNQLCQSQSAS